MFKKLLAFAQNTGIEDLLAAVYRQALKDLLPFVQRGKVSPALRRAAPDAQGKALSAALFLAEYHPTAAGIARDVARSILEQLGSGLPREEAVEESLLAAEFPPSVWRAEMPPLCFRCGRTTEIVWVQIFAPPPKLPAPLRWRYTIPENHVPLCRACAASTAPKDEAVRRLWGSAVWGVRFDHWSSLHEAMAKGQMPKWDKDRFPLWPSDTEDWAQGAGVFRIQYPDINAVVRLTRHREAAQILLQLSSLRRHRRKQSLLWQVAQLDST